MRRPALFTTRAPRDARAEMIEQTARPVRGMTAPAWWRGPISAILRSRFHRLLSGRLLLITVRGRRTGRFYTLPVGYVRAPGVVYVMVGDYETKRWWRNLEGGAPVALVLGGHVADARAAILDPVRDRAEFDRALALYTTRFGPVVRKVNSLLMVRCLLA